MSDDRHTEAVAGRRLLLSRLPDEPFGDKYREYQRILDKAYVYNEEGRLDVACQLLEQRMDLPMLPYQIVRANYLHGKYAEALDAALGATDPLVSEDHLGKAAEYYAQAADVARRIPDWELAARLKKIESDMCYGSNPTRKRYVRAFAASKDAVDYWRAWRELSHCNSTDDVHFEFRLAEDLGVRALMVAADDDAVDALERAAILLLTLRDRADFDPAKYKDYDLYLDWNWAVLHHSMGNYALALKRALLARDKAASASTMFNFGRANSFIAEIALDAVEGEVEWHGYRSKRQLIVAEKAIPKARKAADEFPDAAGQVLAMLVHARWLRHTQWRDDRLAVFEEIQRRALAIEHTDPILFGRVEIAWGDEYAYRNKVKRSSGSVQEARKRYQQAERRLTEVEALGLARVAHKRLVRLFQQTTQLAPRAPRKPSRKPTAPRTGSLSRSSDGD
jgi:hypothetical protein